QWGLGGDRERSGRQRENRRNRKRRCREREERRQVWSNGRGRPAQCDERANHDERGEDDRGGPASEPVTSHTASDRTGPSSCTCARTWTRSTMRTPGSGASATVD